MQIQKISLVCGEVYLVVTDGTRADIKLKVYVDYKRWLQKIFLYVHGIYAETAYIFLFLCRRIDVKLFIANIVMYQQPKNI